MKFLNYLSLAVLLFTVSTAQAHEDHPQKKPAMIASVSEIVTAQVESINHETREVTLKKADGEILSITVKDRVRNLDQVSVGDIVVAEYLETISIQVLAADGPEAGKTKMTAMARAEKGDMPGMAVVETEVEVATVEAINIENNTFKLKDADGTITEYTANNPENLKNSAVGDVVVTTFTQALAMSVEKAPKK